MSIVPRMLLALSLPGVPIAQSSAATTYSGIVDVRFTGHDGDSVQSVPVYRSLGAALTGLTANGGPRTVIFIRNGRYHEKLTIDRPRITLVGESRSGTVITYDAAADTPSPGGGTYGTRGSFTLRIVAPDFRAENLTIENSFDYAANSAKPDSDKTKFRNPQAVALMTDLGSDRAAFINVRILGHQDTLFTNSGRNYFEHCEIAGHVDFIFGAGKSVFEDCDIISLDRGSNSNNGYVTAPSTKADQAYGLVFLKSRLKKERPQIAANSVALGRPWHPFNDTSVNGTSVYIDCWMDDHIGARGWERMSATDSTGTRVWYEPEGARFYERGTTGPGAVKSERRRRLSDAAAAQYTLAKIFDGWIPAR